MADSIVAGLYEKKLDRESAFEKIKGRTESRLDAAASSTGASSAATRDTEPRSNGRARAPAEARNDSAAAAPASGGLLDSLGSIFGGGVRRTRTSAGEQLIRSAASSVGREVGRQIIRGVLGGIFGGKR